MSLVYPLFEKNHRAVMGILNLTPDSFFDGGKNKEVDIAIQNSEKMISEGATVIDIGGMSTRPGAEIIDTIEEQHRILPTLRELVKRFPKTIFSVDTIHAATAIASLDAGATIINDISGGEIDASMFKSIASYSPSYILMHSRGTPQTMSSLTHYENVGKEVYAYLQEKVAQLHLLGLENVLIDPGFGFSKTLEQNYQLLRSIETFQFIGKPILVGISRKSMVQKVIKTTANEALNGTTALHMLALINGANILRVHDVKEAIETIQLFEFYKQTAKANPL